MTFIISVSDPGAVPGGSTRRPEAKLLRFNIFLEVWNLQRPVARKAVFGPCGGAEIASTIV
jgi:hypothetical protein